MKSPLFRQEALDHQSRRSFGDVMVMTPVASSALVGLLATLASATLLWLTTLHYEHRVSVPGYLVPVGGLARLQAPASGQVFQVHVADGDKVRVGQVLLEISEHADRSSGLALVPAPRAGGVTLLRKTAGQPVTRGEFLLALLPEPPELQGELLVPTHAIARIRIGDTVRLRFRAFSSERFGTFEATVSAIADAALMPSAVDALPIEEPVFPVKVALQDQQVGAAGLSDGLKAGMLLDADIALERRSLVESLGLGGR